MRKFKKFKKISDIAFVLGVSLYFVGACFRPDTASGIRIQNIFFIIATVAAITDIVCKTLSKRFKKRYMRELKAALRSCLKK